MDTLLAVIMHEYLHEYFENIKKYKKNFIRNMRPPERGGSFLRLWLFSFMLLNKLID